MNGLPRDYDRWRTRSDYDEIEEEWERQRRIEREIDKADALRDMMKDEPELYGDKL